MPRMRSKRMALFAGLSLGLTMATGAARAADPSLNLPAFAPGAASEWTVTLGAEGRVVPTFEGSDRYTVVPFPVFDLRRAGTPPTFHSAYDGFGFGVIDTGRFRLGPAFKVRLPRNESDDSDLKGLGDVNWAVEAGLFADYWVTPWLRTRAEVRQGFGGHDGIVADLTADVVVPVAPRWTLSGGPRLTLATNAATAPYFSVTAAQSAASGLPIYNASGGVHSYGVGAQARYQWSPQWTTYVFAEYERLADGAANSPIVTQRGSANQLDVGLGVSYSFDMHALW
ncbi:MAG TPA: MipA/OmpV family protein [Pseudolabrys sp.]|nr:MipA/OmpV family protein [Pseudolabrys sp.]